ncbi:hypothetical protein ACN28C_05610 [Plantactinospora sp. WMMC1484]|uniref:hypothetical protein n=1 Tax=Plantactinospora sp. WMMC1484 TaxID=3404122 RepID=UPI003BF4EC68
MTGGQFEEVDLDLLADYVGGALDGTSDENEVARLIAEDRSWAEAYAELTAAVDAVRLDLTGWAAEPTPMPSAVVDRLTAALCDAPVTAVPTATAATASPEDLGKPSDTAGKPSGGARPAGPTHPAGRPGPIGPGVPGRAEGGGSGRASRRRRWMRRLAGPVLVATVVAGFGGFAVGRLVTVGVGSNSQTDTAAGAAEDAAAPQVFGSGPPRVVLEPSAERMLATGTDYTPTSLPDTVSGLTRQAVPGASASRTPPPVSPSSPPRRESAGPTAGTPPPPDKAAADQACCQPMRAQSGLERLSDRSALAECLDAIAATHAQGPVAVELVDYATFEGRAALVVVFTDRSGARWAWVTGPQCGSPAGGADVTYQTRVG